LNLQYCNGQKRYDFSTDESYYYLGCDLKHFHFKDLSPQAFRRAFVKALFAEDQRWLTAAEKHQMLVPGTRKNPIDAARDAAVKEYLREQVSSETYEARKAFYEAWGETQCCANVCDQYCGQCSNKGIKFQTTPTFGLDPDVRMYITRYGRFQTLSELREEEDARRKESTGPVLSRVCNRKSDYGLIRVRGQERGGLPGEPEEVPSDQAKRIEEMLLHPISEEVVT
jgi:hypothetical protein